MLYLEFQDFYLRDNSNSLISDFNSVNVKKLALKETVIRIGEQIEKREDNF